MPILTDTLEVDRSIEEVFAFVGDFANTQVWDPGVASAQNVTVGPIGVGTKYDLQVVFGKRTLPMTYEVIEWDPPNRVVLRGEGTTVIAIDDIRFESTASGTRIFYTADLRLKGVLRFAEPLLRSRFDQTGRQAIAGMRRALEAL
jgi:carbon monoxide dehydrogenase subunit G